MRRNEGTEQGNFLIKSELLVENLFDLGYIIVMTKETANDIKKTKGNDYDSGWKEVMVELFEYFIAYFFPKLHKDIDFTKPPEFLPNELREIDPDNKLGKRVADVLAKVFLKNGTTECFWTVTHVEVDGAPRAKLMERMFVYYYRIYDQLKDTGMKIISLVILIDDEKNFRPDDFKIEGWGFQLKMKIPIIKITDYLWNKKKKSQLAKSTNPIAMVVRAQLKSMELIGTDEERRYEAKRELLRECRRQDYGCNATRVLFRYISWIIRIPEELEKKLKQEINNMVEDKTMQYISIWEKDAWEEGKEEEKLETVKRLLQKGYDLDIIASATDLPIEEIKKLAVEIPITQRIQ